MVFEKLETGKYVTAKFDKHPKPEMLEEVNLEISQSQSTLEDPLRS